MRQMARIDFVVEWAKRYRRTLTGAAITIALYALLGFFFAPWLTKTVAIDSVRERVGAELRLEKLAINPFALSLRINGLELDDPIGEPFARVDEIFVNFQLSSLFRWAWTFDEVRFSAPQLDLSRDSAGRLNVASFAPNSGHADEEANTAGHGGASMPRLLVFNFVIGNAEIDWQDLAPAVPVEARFGPVNIQVHELNTLPDRSGDQSVVITTETSGTLSWNGSLQLNPFRSSGHAAIKGSHLPLTSAYLKHDVGFDFVKGDADVELDYSVDTRSDGSLTASIDHFSFSLTDVLARTFSTASNADQPDREVLKLPLLQISGGTLRWPERTVSVTEFSIDDASVSLHRDENGELNVVRKRYSTDPTSTGHVSTETGLESSAPSPREPWKLSLDRLALNRLEFALEDESVLPTANIGISRLDLSISDMNNEPGTIFPSELELVFPSGGTATLGGELSLLPEPVFELDLTIDNAALAAVHPYLKPLADVNLDSGTLDVTGRLIRDSEEALAFNGNLDINDFLITETDEGSRLGSWVQLHLEKIAYSAAKQSLDISEVQLNQPYGDIRIASDGSVNLGRVAKEDGSETAEKPTEARKKSPLSTTIGRVVVSNASTDFEDQSLPLPFSAKISDLNGNMTTIATNSREPSTVNMEGKVDEFGFVTVTGSLTPIEMKRNTNLLVAFQNVEMPKFSAYTIPFAGREIASGKLDLNLGYQVRESQLTGENKVVLRDFELGEKVEHPGAMSLPLGLAVALLKNAEGKIDIDLPVRGNVDDPEFKYGRVVFKALTNLILKIVASPFALLGNLVGVEASELEYISFIRGRADLTPPELERIAKLAEALSLRPELVLEFSGVVDRQADSIALRTAKFQQIIDSRLAETMQDDESMYAEQQKKILEILFLEQGAMPERRLALKDLVTRFTTSEKSQDSEAMETQFDSLAYTNEIRRQLVELQPMTDIELATLANARAENTRLAIVLIDATLDSRILLGKAQAVETEIDHPVRMKITLAAGDGK